MLKILELYSGGRQIAKYTVKEYEVGAQTKYFTTVNDSQIITNLDFILEDHPEEKKDD